MKIKNIPNMLTILRIILTPIILIFLFLKQYLIAIILTIISALTDMLDGKIARKYKVTSLLGAKLDSFADKIFALSILIYLSFNNFCNFKFNPVIIILLLEIIIACTNIYIHRKTNITKTLMIGKIKTISLFIFIVFDIFTCFIFSLKTITTGLLVATINLQILTIISYIENYFIIKKQQSKMINKNINIDELIKNYKNNVK